MILTPYKFHPVLKTVIWGGERIVAYKGLDTDLHGVGESWELSGVDGMETVVDGGPDDGLTLTQLIDRHGAALLGEKCYKQFGNRFPLLVKLIDAHRDLSVQVHPNNEMAQRLHNCSGKTEMWYILDHEPGAQIIAGFERDITPQEFDRHIADGSVMDVVAHYPSHTGDVYFLPAGCIHAIGAGNLLVEIQQACDITYRVFDYNRLDRNGQKRPLQLELAREALDYTRLDNIKKEHLKNTDTASLITCDEFVVNRIQLQGSVLLNLYDSFLVVICTNGEAQILEGITDNNGVVVDVRQCETVLIPACLTRIKITGSASLITASMPISVE